MGRRYQVPKQQLDVISAGQKEVVRSEGGLYPAVDPTMAGDDDDDDVDDDDDDDHILTAVHIVAQTPVVVSVYCNIS